jgi:hypothetical protein
VKVVSIPGQRFAGGGRIVALFVISRSSHESGARYLKDQLLLSERQTLDLARCSLTADEYYEHLGKIGKVPCRRLN